MKRSRGTVYISTHLTCSSNLFRFTTFGQWKISSLYQRFCLMVLKILALLFQNSFCPLRKVYNKNKRGVTKISDHIFQLGIVLMKTNNKKLSLVLASIIYMHC